MQVKSYGESVLAAFAHGFSRSSKEGIDPVKPIAGIGEVQPAFVQDSIATGIAIVTRDYRRAVAFGPPIGIDPGWSRDDCRAEPISEP